MIRDLNRSFSINQPNYGWGNAVADILGAVMQRNQQRGEIKKQADMYGDIANFGNNLNNLDYGGQTTTQDIASRQNPNSNYTNKTMETKTAQGLLPTSFNQQPPTSNMIGQGLFGQGSMQPVKQTFFDMPNSDQQLQQDQFTATQKAHPEWFRQGATKGSAVYVGDRPDLKQDSIVDANGNITTPQALEPISQYSKANNPVKTTISTPKTLQEQTAMIKAQLAPAMKELIAKGYNPRDVLPLLQQATNDKIAEHTQNYQQQQVNDLYQGFVNEENPNRKAMIAARLKNMGFDVTTAYKEFAPDYVDKVVDSGDAQNLLSFDKKSGKYYDGGKLAKSVSPDARLNADTRIQTTGMNNATTLQAAAMRAAAARSGGGSRSNNYQDGAGTKNGKRLDPLEKQKYGELYNTLLEDIWDSATPAIRAQKIQTHAQDLNELGYYMDRDVENDLRAITG